MEENIRTGWSLHPAKDPSDGYHWRFRAPYGRGEPVSKALPLCW